MAIGCAFNPKGHLFVKYRDIGQVWKLLLQAGMYDKSPLFIRLPVYCRPKSMAATNGDDEIHWLK